MKQIEERYCLRQFAVKKHLFYRVVGYVKRDLVLGSKIEDKGNLWHVSPGYTLQTEIRTRHFPRAQNAHISLSHCWCSCLVLHKAELVRRTVSYFIVCGANINLFVYTTICLTNTTRVSFMTN
jgi:hypothetical protein